MRIFETSVSRCLQIERNMRRTMSQMQHVVSTGTSKWTSAVCSLYEVRVERKETGFPTNNNLLFRDGVPSRVPGNVIMREVVLR